MFLFELRKKNLSNKITQAHLFPSYNTGLLSTEHCVSSDNRDPCLSLFLKDIGCACAAVWPVSPHHWSRPSGSGGQWSRFWLLLRWMSPGRGTPCGFHGTLWNSRQGRSCHLHADGRCLTDRPLSLYRANQWWLMRRRSGSTKGERE